MSERFSRTQLLLGEENMRRLSQARVAIFGIGGVGGYVAEALARCGIGAFVLVDSDRVCESNLNRQIIATEETIGEYKTRAMRDRIRSINPEAEVEERRCFFLPENAGEFDFREYSYVVDAVDTVTAKLQIISQAAACHVPVISCMGAGNKLDPTKLRVADIYETSVCPLAKVMRRECRKRGIRRLKVVYSTEEAIHPRQSAESCNPEIIRPQQSAESCNPEIIRPQQSAESGASRTNSGIGGESGSNFAAEMPDACRRGIPDGICGAALSAAEMQGARRRSIPGSVSFVPSVAGLILAGEVIKDLCILPTQKSQKENAGLIYGF